MDKPNINLIFATDKNTCYGKEESKPVNANSDCAELADVKWIKQPVIYSMISGTDFTLMQMNIIIALSKAIQERIEEYLSRNCKSQGGESSSPFFE